MYRLYTYSSRREQEAVTRDRLAHLLPVRGIIVTTAHPAMTPAAASRESDDILNLALQLQQYCCTSTRKMSPSTPTPAVSRSRSYLLKRPAVGKQPKASLARATGWSFRVSRLGRAAVLLPLSGASGCGDGCVTAPSSLELKFRAAWGGRRQNLSIIKRRGVVLFQIGHPAFH